jgi:hypothetical protein
MFLEHFLAQILIRSSFDVFRHVCANVCLSLISAFLLESQTVTSTSKIETLLSILRRRQRFSHLHTLRPETTSIRIPILSP